MLHIKKHKIIKFKCHCLLRSWCTEEMCIVKHTLSDDATYISECNGCENYNGSRECEKCRAIITLMFRNGYKIYGNEILEPDITVLPLDNE